MDRRTFARGLLCLIALGASAATSFAQYPGPPRATAGFPITTVIVVRHAEKAAQPAGDPPLTAEGRARAEALAIALKGAGVTAVITTQWLRSRQTGDPTALEFRAMREPLATTSPVANHAKAVAEAVLQHAGGTVLVVGHSNTAADIVAALGADRPAELCDDEYDAMFIVTLRGPGDATVVKARYGKPTPVAPDCGKSMK